LVSEMLPTRDRRRRVSGMRAVLLSMVFFPWACSPKVAVQTTPLDDDVAMAHGGRMPAPVEAAPPVPTEPVVQRPLAPPGKGLRNGTIPRDRLLAVLDAGAGMFLRQLELAPKLAGERFVGWQLVQLVDKLSPLADLDIVPGDVLLAINGKPLSRPDQLQTIWDSLRTANEVTAQLWRGDNQLTITFAIEPKL
jgi:membrane-associated protease RseP (regulator of RpoE activity)